MTSEAPHPDYWSNRRIAELETKVERLRETLRDWLGTDDAGVDAYLDKRDAMRPASDITAEGDR